MKAAVYYEHGGPEVFRYEDVPDPVCHRKGIVIRVEAGSVEGGDLLDRSGNLSAVDPCPHVMLWTALHHPRELSSLQAGGVRWVRWLRSVWIWRSQSSRSMG